MYLYGTFFLAWRMNSVGSTVYSVYSCISRVWCIVLEISMCVYSCMYTAVS